MILEGNATPAWLANDFNASRRHALIVAQIVKLAQKLTDDAVSMFIKLIGRLFSQANNRRKQRHMDCRPDTAKALRMFLDTITALQSANDYGRNALDALDQEVGWHRLLRMKPELESMVEDNEAVKSAHCCLGSRHAIGPVVMGKPRFTATFRRQ